MVSVTATMEKFENARKKGEAPKMNMKDEQLLADIQLEVLNIATLAKKEFKKPLDSSNFMGDLMVSLFSEPLQLSKQQKNEIRTVIKESFKKFRSSIGKKYQMLLIESCVEKERFNRFFYDSLNDLLNNDQKNIFKGLHLISNMFLEPSSRTLTIGVKSAQNAKKRILKHWQEIFALEKDSNQDVIEIAEDYANEAILILKDYHQFQSKPEKLTKEEAEKLKEQSRIFQIGFPIDPKPFATQTHYFLLR